MTVTLKPWMTVLLIATVCVLAGFTAGQVTTANSDATTSARTVVVQDRVAQEQLRQINKKLGATYVNNTVLSQLEQVIENTYATCRDASYSSFCSYSD